MSIEGAVTRIKALAPELLVLSAAIGGVYYIWKEYFGTMEENVNAVTDSVMDLKNSLQSIQDMFKTISERRDVRAANMKDN